MNAASGVLACTPKAVRTDLDSEFRVPMIFDQAIDCTVMSGRLAYTRVAYESNWSHLAIAFPVIKSTYTTNFSNPTPASSITDT